MSKLFRLVAFAFLALLGASAQAAPNASQDVRNTVLGFSTDWNDHDMVAFGKLFAPDADFVNVGGAWWKGRDSIQSHHAWSHGVIPRDTPGFSKDDPHYGIFRTSTMKFVDIDVRFLRPDVALARVKWELTGDTRTAEARHGMLAFVLTHQDGAWLIAAAQNTEINRTVH